MNRFYFTINTYLMTVILSTGAVAADNPQSCTAAIKAQVEQLSKNPETQIMGSDLLPLLADLVDCLDQTEFKASHLEKVEGQKAPLMVGEESQ